MTMLRSLMTLPLMLAATTLHAQGAAPVGAVAGDEAPAAGSPTFCLFELPPVNERRQWLNLVHVQYIELRGDELRLYFGGGNLGSGHEARLPIRHKDDAPALLKRLQETARACR